MLVLQRILWEALIDIFYFPLWWYAGGAKHALFWCAGLFKRGNQALGPGLWLKNIFVPMYGQFDWQGRLISFFIRLVNVLGRYFALVVWFAVVGFIFLLWLIFPGIVCYGLIRSFTKI